MMMTMINHKLKEISVINKIYNPKIIIKALLLQMSTLIIEQITKIFSGLIKSKQVVIITIYKIIKVVK